MNVLVIVLYLIAMVVIGLWAARRARTATDYRVAGRRLGMGLYTSTMAAVVIAYSVLGGMWSITLTDLMQFVFMTVGIFAILLPFSLAAGGGWSGIRERLDSSFFDLGAMGLQGIITQFVIYGFGMLIGQDIWQRVFTARSPGVARWGGVISAGYVALYGVAGALIGTAAAAVLPTLEMPDEAFATMAQQHVPVGLGGVVLAAGVAAMMSTAPGTTIAAGCCGRAPPRPAPCGPWGWGL